MMESVLRKMAPNTSFYQQGSRVYDRGRIKDWQTDVQASAEAFVLKLPADAKKVELETLRKSTNFHQVL
jgi:hypothetical protein